MSSWVERMHGEGREREYSQAIGFSNPIDLRHVKESESKVEPKARIEALLMFPSAIMDAECVLKLTMLSAFSFVSSDLAVLAQSVLFTHPTLLISPWGNSIVQL